MKILSREERNFAICALIYSQPGFGKTYSIGSAPGPVYFVVTEPRDPRQVLRPFLDEGKEIDFAVPESLPMDFVEFMEHLNECSIRAKAGEFPYKTVAVDSASFLHGQLKENLEDSMQEDLILEAQKANKAEDRLRLMPKRHDISNIRYEGWGAMGSYMKRFTSITNSLTQSGVNVIMTAWLGENPRRADAEQGYPLFLGKDYSNFVAGYFDVIGRLFQNPEEGSNGYPPIVCFRTLRADEKRLVAGNPGEPAFLAKCANAYLNKKPIQKLDDWSRLIDIMAGKVSVEEKEGDSGT